MSYSYSFEITNGSESGGAFTWDGSVSQWNGFANDAGALTATGQSKATFNLNPPGGTGTSPGRFRPGISGVVNLPDQDIDVGGEPSSSAHITFTNNVWSTSHSTGYVWTITRSSSGGGGGTNPPVTLSTPVISLTRTQLVGNGFDAGTYTFRGPTGPNESSQPGWVDNTVVVSSNGEVSVNGTFVDGDYEFQSTSLGYYKQLTLSSGSGSKKVFCNFW